MIVSKPWMNSVLVAGFIVTALAGPVRVSAQDSRSNTRGLVLSAGFSGVSLEVETGDAQTGSGGHLLAGYAPSRLVSIFLRGDVARVDIDVADIDGSYNLIFADLGIRFSIGSGQHTFVPYLVAAFTGQSAKASIPVTPLLKSDVSINGAGFTLGGGFDVFFTRTLALDLGVLLTSGRFSEVSVGSLSSNIDSLDSRAARVTLGLSWFPVIPRN